LVVTSITPFAALTPYIAAADASFKTVRSSISEELKKSILSTKTPSTTKSGLA